MKQINKTCIRLLSLLMLFLFTGIGNVWADETVTWTCSTTLGSSTIAGPISGNINDDLSFESSQGGANNATAYNKDGSVRLYANNGNGSDFTIKPATGVTGITITKVVITSQTNPTVKYSVDGGDNTNAGSWTGSANPYTLTIDNISATTSFKIINANTTNVQLQITKFYIEYTKEGSDPVLQSIAISGTPKLEYEVGEVFSVAGLKVMATYDSGEPIDKTSAAEWTIEPSTAFETVGANQTVSVTANVGEETAIETYNVNVTAAEGDKITPNKISFPTNTNSGSYANWTSDINGATAVYKGNSAKRDDKIQLRGQTSAGIVSTTSGGIIKKVKIEWNSTTSTSNSRKLMVYGSHSAYTTPADLYDDNKKGTLLGEFTYSSGATIATLTATDWATQGDFEYVGVVANQPIYLNEITFVWEAPTAKAITTATAPEGVGTVSVKVDDEDVTEALAGKTVVIAATPNNATAYRFKSWEVKDSDNENVAVTENEGVYSFTMPNKEVNVKANFAQLYKVTLAVDAPLEDGATGTPKANDVENAIYVEENEEFTLSANPAVGSKFDSWSVSTEDDHILITSTTAENTTATVDANVTITAVYEKLSLIALDAPTLNRPTVTYNSAVLSWEEVENAQWYVLNIKQGEIVVLQNKIIDEGTSYTFENAEPATEYTYSVYAVGDDETYLYINEAANGSFTTLDLPAAKLYLSINNGTASAYGENHTLNDEVTLPSTIDFTPAGNVVFMGWTENNTITDASVQPSSFYAPGATYTLSSKTQTLYAVFAEKSSGDVYYQYVNINELVANTVYIFVSKNTAGSAYALDASKLTISAGNVTGTSVTVVASGENIIVENAQANLEFEWLGNAAMRIVGNTENYLTINGSGLLYKNSSYKAYWDNKGLYGTNDKGTKKYYVYLNSTNFTKAESPSTRVYAYERKQNSTISNYSLICAVAPAVPTFNLSDGETYNENKTLTITAEDGATVYYTTDGETVPTAASTAYTTGIACNTVGTHTIWAVAIKDGVASNVAKITFTIDRMYTIHEFVTLQPTTNVKVDLTDAVILAVAKKNIYLQSGDDALILFNNANSTNFAEVANVAIGKKITEGNATGSYTTWSGANEMTGTTLSETITTTDGTLAIAAEIEGVATSADNAHIGKLVKIKVVYFQSTTVANNITVKDANEAECVVYNTLGTLTGKTLPDAETACDVTGVLLKHNGTYEVAPVAIEVQGIKAIDTKGAKASLPTISLAGGVDAANAEQVANGEEITLTAQANTTIKYALNENALALVTGTIKITADCALKVTAERDFYTTNEVVYYYAVNEALTKHSIVCATVIGGTISASEASAAMGATITLTATPAAHYSFGEWAVIYNDGEEKTITPDKNNQFTMPAYDVMVSATFNEDAKYSVTFANGAATATGDAPTMDAQYEDEQITLPANTFTYTGHKFTGWNDGNNTYAAGATYTMPAAAVTFTAQWEELSSWAYVYTSNVTMEGEGNNYAGNVKYGEEGTEYAGKRAGKKDGAGSVKVTIPANATALHFHAAAWSGDNVTLIVKDGDNVILSQKLESDGGIQGNGTTYPLDNDLFTYYYSISFSPTLLEEKEIVFTTNSSSEKTYRFVLFGVNAEVTTLDVAENETISENASYGNVIIEAGKALTVNAALTVTGNLVLQAKDDNKPEVVLNGDVTATNMYYEWTVATNSNNVFALPCNVAWADIEYWNGTAWDDNFNLFITTYNGQSRAEYGVADEEHHNWRYLPATEALQANVGYILYVPAGQVNNLTEVTLRFKLSDAALSRAPRTYSTTAYTATNGEGNAADAGWNYVGNPLLQSYASSVGDVKYATIPNLAGTAYTQGPVTSNVLKPFTPFFVQVEGAKTLTFSLNAPAAMPALYRVENEQAELFAEVTLDNERTGLWMADKYTTAYEINADLVKMFGENTTTVYTVSGNTRLAYNALPDAAAEAIPVGFSALAGEHTFSLAEGYSDGFEQLNLIDHVAGAVIDLLSTDYTFTLTENESMNETRFELNAVRADAAGQTTGIEAVGHELLNEGVYKLLIDGKVYIIRNGVWYDVTGRMVK